MESVLRKSDENLKERNWKQMIRELVGGDISNQEKDQDFWEQNDKRGRFEHVFEVYIFSRFILSRFILSRFILPRFVCFLNFYSSFLRPLINFSSSIKIPFLLINSPFANFFLSIRSASCCLCHKS